MTTAGTILPLPLLLLLFCAGPLRAAELIEAGPEDGGMRLRLMVNPVGDGTNEAFRVRVELINVTNHPIRLRADWTGDNEKGDFKDYFEARLKIESYPEIMPDLNQVAGGERHLAQPEYTLNANETVAIEWTTRGRKIRTDSPTFPVDGLYSVHASSRLCVADAKQARRKEALNRAESAETGRSFTKSVDDSAAHNTIFLRSNEQLVPVGGSRAKPKHTMGRIAAFGQSGGAIDLGAMHKVQIGDQFRVYSKYKDHQWILTIRQVMLNESAGVLEPVPSSRAKPDISYLKPGDLAELLLKPAPAAAKGQ